MTPEEVKAYLSGHSEATKNMIEIFMKENNRRFEKLEDQFNKMKVENAELRESLQFSQGEIDTLKSTIEELKSTLKSDTPLVQDLKKQVDKLTLRCDDQEDRSRRSNLRFDNIPESEGGETWEKSSQLISDLLEKKLDLGSSIELERAHRVGSYDPTNSRPRTIVAKFLRYGDREAAFRNAKKLKGTGIIIKEDLCEASRKKRAEQWSELKQAWNNGQRAYFSHNKLKIKPMNKRNNNNNNNKDSGSSATPTPGAWSPSSARPITPSSPPHRPPSTAGPALSQGATGEANTAVSTAAAAAAAESRIGHNQHQQSPVQEASRRETRGAAKKK